MRKWMLLLLVSAALIGCSPETVPVHGDMAKGMTENLRYVRDEKTGICYAALATRSNEGYSSTIYTVTYVPCTAEVIAQLGK